MMGGKRSRLRCETGQSLLETILIIPLLLLIIANAINFGYFFLMALNLTSASRSSTLYSIMGSATPASTGFAPAGPTTSITSVSYLAYQDLTGSVSAPTVNGSVQVCSPSVGITNPGTTTTTTTCSSFPSTATFPAPHSDPELNSSNTATAFILNRVDIRYDFSPPLPAMPFNLVVLLSPACSSSGGNTTCTFYRHAEMRGM
ncbi:MAG TPA: TadE/TadG family type IV pilus assembly protein [Terriglobales bacterium]|nr:TadE/TadG family type IV pilus assembly protein [Terriglobales bacterium]